MKNVNGARTEQKEEEMEEHHQPLDEKFLKKISEIVEELEKQKLPLVVRVYVWVLRRKLKKHY